MQSSELLKKRLKNLKRLSQNLKQSTQLQYNLDATLIKAIFDITKIINKEQNHPHSSTVNFQNFKKNLPKQNNSTNKLQNYQFKKTQNLIIPQQQLIRLSFGYKVQDQSLQQHFYQKNEGTDQVFSKKDETDLYNHRIRSLKQQKFRLYIKLNQIQQQIRFYEQHQLRKTGNLNHNAHDDVWDSQILDENAMNNSHPYFRFYEQIPLYLTKQSICRQDFGKIQYKTLPISLLLDKILIQKDNQQKLIQENKISLLQQLDLGNLKQVNYLSNKCMLLIFSQADRVQKIQLFLNFPKEQMMHRWDLGIFINFKIINSLNVDRLFQRQEILENSLNPEKQNQIQQELQNKQTCNSSQDIQIIKNFLENKRKYIQSHKILKKHMLYKIQQQKQRLKRQQGIERNGEKNYENNQNFRKQKINQNQSFKTYDDKNLLATKQDTLKVQNIQRINQLQKKVQKIKIQNNEQKLLKVQSAFVILQKGIYMTKYAKGALKPHEKKVYISQDNKKLCWEDKNSTQFKFVLVSDIESIKRGQIGPGVSYHLNIKKIQNLNCFLMISLNSKQRKSLDFSATNQKQIDQFYQSLIIFLNEIRK